MCGIVGYSGSDDPGEIILKGLQAVEYRGYDSAGVAIFDHGEVQRVRAEGKLVHLQNKLKGRQFTGPIGIGHTRWATHGRPSERNAHPHSVDGISIVHNGIIENCEQLREYLRTEDTEFHSDTDSELIAHLIARELKSHENLLQSVFHTLPQMEGAFSVLAISDQYPDEIVAFKNGPPLVVASTDHSVTIASDVLALAEQAKDLVYLNDFEVAHIQGSRFQLYDRDQKILRKKFVQVDWNQNKVEKHGYPHYMLKEIFEQPRAVASAIEPHINLDRLQVELHKIGFGEALDGIKNLDRESDLKKTFQVFSQIEKIFIVACGTSYYASMVGKYIFEQMAEIPVETDIASEFRYRKPVFLSNSLFIAISQSGETADTMAALNLAKEQGALTLSLCNVKHSSIDRASAGHIYMNAGTEVGVASTKAFVCTLSLLNLLGIFIAKTREKITLKEEQNLVRNILAVPSQMEAVLSYDTFFKETSETLKQYRGLLYMGRGLNYPIAMEGALKLKELAYMHAEGYAAGEMKHGPLALVDESMLIVMLAPSDELYEKTVNNLEEARSRGGAIISIGNGNNQRLKKLSDHYLSLPVSHSLINPILSVIPLQLLAYHISVALEHNVDQPRNLAKSVTVE